MPCWEQIPRYLIRDRDGAAALDRSAFETARRLRFRAAAISKTSSSVKAVQVEKIALRSHHRKRAFPFVRLNNGLCRPD
jgi:hypothetical protein